MYYINKIFLITALLVVSRLAMAQQFSAGPPLGAVNESGVLQPISGNVRVFGGFVGSESCTFDAGKNLILAMNAGNRGDGAEQDGYVSLLNPDGSVHTLKWIGASREGLELRDPLGSAVSQGVLYTVDSGFLRSFDLVSGQPLASHAIPGSSLLNGIAVAADGTAYISNSQNPEVIYRVTESGEVSIFTEGAPLAVPNGVALDQLGNIVVVNIGSNAVLTYNTEGELIGTEYTVESGNDGVVVTEDGSKYVSSVRFGSVSRIRPGETAEIIASGIPTPASMCYDSVQKQLVIPLNRNNAMAFIRL